MQTGPNKPRYRQCRQYGGRNLQPMLLSPGLVLILAQSAVRALRRLAADRGRSIHSLVIEAVDALTGKPVLKPWD